MGRPTKKNIEENSEVVLNEQVNEEVDTNSTETKVETNEETNNIQTESKEPNTQSMPKSNDVDVVKIATEMAMQIIKQMGINPSTNASTNQNSNQQSYIATNDKGEKLINCLRPGERVIVRFLKKKRGFIDNPDSPLFGGMADTSTIRLVVPRLGSGTMQNPLTNNEKAFLESIMGVNLSVYGKPNYWCNSNPESINFVMLNKLDKVLDLGIPEDYIRYKILLLNNDIVCPSLQELEDRPKMTYKSVIVNEKAETSMAGKKAMLEMNTTIKLNKYIENRMVLRTIIRLMEGSKASRNESLEKLQSRVLLLLKSDLKRFAKILEDDLIEIKSYIDEAVERGVIRVAENKYYLREGNIPLCHDNEEPRFHITAAYLAEPMNQDLLATIIAKCNM